MDKIADFRQKEILKEFPNSNRKPLKYSMTRILSATRQLVAGLNYNITFRMKDADCEKACDVELCNVLVYVKPWENYTEVTNFTCKPQIRVGQVKTVANDDKSALQALDFAMVKLNQKSNDLFYKALMDVKSVKKQIVKGIKYTLEFTMGKTGCQKNADKLSECLVESNAKPSTCSVTIWDQPWLKEERYKILEDKCE